MSEHIVSPRIYVTVFIALTVGTGLTVAAAGQDLGVFNTPVAMAIAITKATLVVLFFMHVKYSSRLTWVVVAAAFLWLMLLIGGTASDYYSPHISGPAKTPSIARQ